MLTLIKLKYIMKKNKSTNKRKVEEHMKLGWNVIALLLLIGITAIVYTVAWKLIKKYLTRW